MTDQQNTIELGRGPQDESLVVDPADGEFVAISRLTISRDFRPGQPLKFEVVRTLDASEFYSLLDQAFFGSITIGDLSDQLVRAFDLSKLLDRSGRNCMYVWRRADGLMVEQHST